jgi:hypothetical protein
MATPVVTSAAIACTMAEIRSIADDTAVLPSSKVHTERAGRVGPVDGPTHLFTVLDTFVRPASGAIRHVALTTADGSLQVFTRW